MAKKKREGTGSFNEMTVQEMMDFEALIDSTLEEHDGDIACLAPEMLAYLDDITKTREDKFSKIAYVIKQKQLSTENLLAWETHYSKKRKSVERALTELKNITKNYMQKSGLTQINTGIGNVRLQQNSVDSSMIILDEASIPPAYISSRRMELNSEQCFDFRYEILGLLEEEDISNETMVRVRDILDKFSKPVYDKQAIINELQNPDSHLHEFISVPPRGYHLRID